MVQVAGQVVLEPSHCLVILASPLVDTGPGHSAAEEDYKLRRQMTARWPRAGIIIILRRSYKLWAKAIYGEPAQPSSQRRACCASAKG